MTLGLMKQHHIDKSLFSIYFKHLLESLHLSITSDEYENDLDIDISPVTENDMSDAANTTIMSVDSVESLADDNDVVDEKDSSESSSSDDEGNFYNQGD